MDDVESRANDEEGCEPGDREGRGGSGEALQAKEQDSEKVERRHFGKPREMESLGR